jgi:hypothetical protein
MLLHRDLKRTALIRIRPYQDGKLLYFPYGFDKGGPGVLVPEAQGQVLRYREWSPFNFVFVPMMLLLFLIVVLSGSAAWGYILGVLEGLVLGELFRRHQETVFARMTASLPPAPYRLTEDRYWQELAVQYSGLGLVAWMVFTVVLVLAVTLSFLGSLGQMFGSGMLVALHLAAVAVTVMQVRKMARLLKGRAQAKRGKVIPGTLEGLAAV